MECLKEKINGFTKEIFRTCSQNATQALDTSKLVELQLFLSKVCGTKDEGSRNRWVISIHFQQDRKWLTIKCKNHIESLVFGT